MNDFKNNSQNNKSKFSNQQNNTNGTNKNVNPDKKSANNMSGPEINQTINMAKIIANTCNGKSEGQILKTILAQAEQGKRNGTLTNADLDNFYTALAPLLDNFKRKKLAQIIIKLKEI